MRAIGTPKLLSWRWAPCVALVAGASCFAAFAMLVIPERIGSVPAPSSGSAAFRTNIDSSVASEQGSSSRFSNADSGSRSSTSFSSLPPNGAARVASNGFPKRGFTPPLERPEPPPAPPPVVPPQPALEAQPPVAVPVPPPPDAPPPQDAQSASLGTDQPRPTD